ncbi:unnamed protein product [Acanthoscelides obtectus]|uniref:Uncharacterized protein n=1 Tax=Acanthoscelides obtectus TaxID=200917 RepID=A0A9P0JH02_ACAOB|nr:unnamed protein product [Acanthoscelides obtectus]CAK1639787.1 hypothetical protein AOBTE_LOCUS11373 [Acanthoscelides obtectus]
MYSTMGLIKLNSFNTLTQNTASSKTNLSTCLLNIVSTVSQTAKALRAYLVSSRLFKLWVIDPHRVLTGNFSDIGTDVPFVSVWIFLKVASER